MTDLFDWIQDNWFELGSLTAQFVIAGVLMWYGRTILSIVSAYRRQAEPAARLSETQASFAPEEMPVAAYGGVGRMLSPMPGAPELQAEPAPRRRVKRISPWRAMMKWLREPMFSGRRSMA